jgi:hypothetical protein
VCNPPEMIAPHSRAARLLAVEVLLANPEALLDDVFESCLYLMRDRLQGTDTEDAGGDGGDGFGSGRDPK